MIELVATPLPRMLESRLYRPSKYSRKFLEFGSVGVATYTSIHRCPRKTIGIPMIQLHYSPSSAAMVPHILLEEIEVQYERILVDTKNQANRQADYLQLNPNGHVPVLVDGDLILYETAAISLYLCDAYKSGCLAPPIGTDSRAHFYKWLIWLTNTLQAALIIYFYPQRWVNPEDETGIAALKRHAENNINGMLKQLDDEIFRVGGSWFLGNHYTALDAYIFTLCRWTRNFEYILPASKRVHLGPYLHRMLDRPAVQRVLKNESLNPPYI